MNNFDLWNKAAQRYHEKFSELNIYNESYDAFLAALPPNGNTVLDFGCGPGIIGAYLKEHLPDTQIVFADPAQAMLDIAVQRVPDAVCICAAASGLRLLGDYRFDGIACGFVLPYIPFDEVPLLFSDLRSLMKDRGVLYLSFVPAEEAKAVLQTNSLGDQTIFRYHQPAEVSKLLRNAGFEQVAMFEIYYEPAAELHLCLVCRVCA